MKIVEVMNHIPTFIIEEHNEAFYVWNYCIENRLMPNTENVLLHVDEHADMGVPKFNTPITELTGNLSEVQKFVQDEIGIGSFIVPAMYLGFFRKISWVKLEQKVKSHQLYVRSYNAEGLRLLMGPVTQEINAASEKDRDLRFFQYDLNTVESIKEDSEVILDIDLDYFSCSGNPVEIQDITIEISKNEYENFLSNPYHKIRFLGFKPTVKKLNSKYYLTINDYKHMYPDLYPFTLKVDLTVIENRIDDLMNSLIRNRLVPRVITWRMVFTIIF